MTAKLAATGLFAGLTLMGLFVPIASAQDALCEFHCRNTDSVRLDRCDTAHDALCYAEARQTANRDATAAELTCKGLVKLGQSRYVLLAPIAGTLAACKNVRAETYRRLLAGGRRRCDSRRRTCRTASKATLRSCLTACDPHAEARANCRRDGGEWDDAACVCNMQGSYQL